MPEIKIEVRIMLKSALTKRLTYGQPTCRSNLCDSCAYEREQQMSDIAERVKKIVAEHLGVEEWKVAESASFIDDLGADSIDTVALVMAFEEEFGVEIPDVAAEKILTVKNAIEFIEQHMVGIIDTPKPTDRPSNVFGRLTLDEIKRRTKILEDQWAKNRYWYDEMIKRHTKDRNDEMIKMNKMKKEERRINAMRALAHRQYEELLSNVPGTFQHQIRHPFDQIRHPFGR